MKNKKIIYIVISIVSAIMLCTLCFDMEVEDSSFQNEIEVVEELSKEEVNSSEIKTYCYDVVEKNIREELVNIEVDKLKGDIFFNVFEIMNGKIEDINKESIGEMVKFNLKSTEFLNGTLTLRIEDVENTFNMLDENKKMIVYDIIQKTYMEFNEVSNIKIYINDFFIEK